MARKSTYFVVDSAIQDDDSLMDNSLQEALFISTSPELPSKVSLSHQRTRNNDKTKSTKRSQPVSSCAIKIQKVFRGYLGRREAIKMLLLLERQKLKSKEKRRQSQSQSRAIKPIEVIETIQGENGSPTIFIQRMPKRSSLNSSISSNNLSALQDIHHEVSAGRRINSNIVKSSLTNDNLINSVDSLIENPNIRVVMSPHSNYSTNEEETDSLNNDEDISLTPDDDSNIDDTVSSNILEDSLNESLLNKSSNTNLLDIIYDENDGHEIPIMYMPPRSKQHQFMNSHKHNSENYPTPTLKVSPILKTVANDSTTIDNYSPSRSRNIQQDIGKDQVIDEFRQTDPLSNQSFAVAEFKPSVFIRSNSTDHSKIKRNLPSVRDLVSNQPNKLPMASKLPTLLPTASNFVASNIKSSDEEYYNQLSERKYNNNDNKSRFISPIQPIPSLPMAPLITPPQFPGYQQHDSYLVLRDKRSQQQQSKVVDSNSSRQKIIQLQNKRHQASILIQKCIRGYLGRKVAKLRQQQLQMVVNDRFKCRNCGRLEQIGVYCKGCGRRNASVITRKSGADDENSKKNRDLEQQNYKSLRSQQKERQKSPLNFKSKQNRQLSPIKSDVDNKNNKISNNKDHQQKSKVDHKANVSMEPKSRQLKSVNSNTANELTDKKKQSRHNGNDPENTFNILQAEERKLLIELASLDELQRQKLDNLQKQQQLQMQKLSPKKETKQLNEPKLRSQSSSHIPRALLIRKDLDQHSDSGEKLPENKGNTNMNRIDPVVQNDEQRKPKVAVTSAAKDFRSKKTPLVSQLKNGISSHSSIDTESHTVIEHKNDIIEPISYNSPSAISTVTDDNNNGNYYLEPGYLIEFNKKNQKRNASAGRFARNRKNTVDDAVSITNSHDVKSEGGQSTYQRNCEDNVSLPQIKKDMSSITSRRTSSSSAPPKIAENIKLPRINR